MASDLNERIKIINELDKNLLVSASAGSGKTTILVERMVALIENGKVNLSKMAALTFTKKAAGEFYDRFYKKLQLRTNPNFLLSRDDKYSLLGNPTPEAIKRDKEALKHIDTCFFGTIDAYYQKILNEHPFEAKLSSSAKIIDDEEFSNYLLHKFSDLIKSDNDDIREGALFFNELLGASLFAEVMNNVLSHNDLEISKINIPLETLQKGYSYLLSSFKAGANILVNNEATFRLIKEKDGVLTDCTKNNKKNWDFLKENIHLIESLKDDDYRQASKIFKKFNDFRLPEDSQGLLTVDNFFSNFVEEHTNKKGKVDYLVINDALTVALNKVSYYKIINFITKVRSSIYEEMISDGVLTFSLATDCLLSLLRNEQEYKSTIDQIRSKIDTLLIDECQDTDIKQYEIFFRLTAKDYNEHFEKLTIDGGKLYACGDRKQGIYHFRGADVSTYDYIKTLFEGYKSSGLPFDLVTMTDNHRSNGKLINYFNETFSEVLEEQGYSPILNDEIKKEDSNFGVFTYDTDKDSDPTNVANIILDFVYNKGYSFKDFMVMTSSKQMISSYAKAFAEKSIPCYSEGNIDISISSLLNAVICLFKFIASKKTDLISYFELLSSPLFNFDIKDTIDVNRDYLSFVKNKDYLNVWPSNLLEDLASNTKILGALNCIGIDILIGFIHILKETENSGEIVSYDDAIKYFTDLQNGNKGVERLSLLANNINAVQIANAHKTKGLEKEIVILTKANIHNQNPEHIVADKYYIISKSKQFKKGKSVVLSNPLADFPPLSDLIEKEKAYEEEENLRLLYVAATRARKYLLISNTKKKDGARDPQNKWSPLFTKIPSTSEDIVVSTDFKSEIKETKLIDEWNNVSKTYDLNRKSFDIVIPSKVETFGFEVNPFKPSTNKDDALIYGTMVHKLMECIVKSKAIQLDESLCDYIASKYGRIDLASKLKNVMKIIYNGGYAQHNAMLSDLYKLVKENVTYTEVPFSYKKEKEIVSGNIDLIIERENDVLIIDYKTDTVETDHTNQLNCYINALKSSGEFTSKEIKAFIYNLR